MTIRCHFDGKVFVPDEPVKLPINQPAEVSVANVDREPAPSLAAIDWSQWIGIGNRFPKNPDPRFESDDDLWVKD